MIGSRYGDFLLGVKFFGRDGSHLATYCADPGVAQWFATLEEGRRVVAEMGKADRLDVLPLFDCGDVWRVAWPREWDIR